MLGVNRIGFTKLSDGEDAGDHSQGGKRVKYEAYGLEICLYWRKAASFSYTAWGDIHSRRGRAIYKQATTAQSARRVGANISAPFSNLHLPLWKAIAAKNLQPHDRNRSSGPKNISLRMFLKQECGHTDTMRTSLGVCSRRTTRTAYRDTGATLGFDSSAT